MIADSLATMNAGGDRQSEHSATLPNAITQPEAAEMLNVSERLVQDARALRKASPELAEQVTRGEKTVTQARREVQEQANAEMPRQQLGEESIDFAHRVKIDALARLGELLREVPKAKGAAGIGGAGLRKLSKHLVPTD